MGLGADSDSSPATSNAVSEPAPAAAGGQENGDAGPASGLGPIGFGDGSGSDIGSLIKAALLQGWGAGAADAATPGHGLPAALDSHGLDLGKLAAADHLGDTAYTGGEAMADHAADHAYDAHVPLALTGGDLLPAVGATLDLLTSSPHLADVPAIDSHDSSGDMLPT